MTPLKLRPPRTLWLPKAGNSSEEYEDSHCVAYPQRIGASGNGLVRIAVADGASEAAFAREWANALTDAFAHRPPELCGLNEESLNAWLLPARERWHAGVPWDSLPWHGEAKARAGAFATLLGLTVGAAADGSGGLSWRALAVGDCCLFIVRDGRLALSFPLEDASEFGITPALLCSSPDGGGAGWEAVRLLDGECAPGDLLLLATDAVACWFLAANAVGEQPWETLAALDSSTWPAWVAQQRNAGLMRNDDATLVAVEVV